MEENTFGPQQNVPTYLRTYQLVRCNQVLSQTR